MPENPRCLTSSEYDDDTYQMILVFVKRGSWLYYNVDRNIFDALQERGNSGTFFNTDVRPVCMDYIQISNN